MGSDSLSVRARIGRMAAVALTCVCLSYSAAASAVGSTPIHGSAGSISPARQAMPATQPGTPQIQIDAAPLTDQAAGPGDMVADSRTGVGALLALLAGLLAGRLAYWLYRLARPAWRRVEELE